MADFTFCPNTMVPETIPRDPTQVVTMNGWTFTAKPTTPFVRRFKITLHGLRWLLNSSTGLYDATTTPAVNAKALEDFYKSKECWSPFTFKHPHIAADLTVRFAQPVVVPAALPNSGGWCAPLEIQLVEHNPGYS